ncbi:hypothetical protein [Cohnella sp. GCM10027633]|uniref:hypothetical protein n=1 Tax=unclassified Cohnella TaxID=2636738 RepID=UPI00362680F5
METKELRESHIIPNFIGKWIKETSATGFLRSALNPNRRAQDLAKLYLLCGECEELFSINEKRFAENVFIPFQNGQKRFDYDEWLLKFFISINWRVGILEVRDPKNGMPENLMDELVKCLEIWREYLLGRSKETGGYKHHIFFLDTLESVGSEVTILEYTNAYLLRTTDATVANNTSNAFIYAKLPGIIMVSHIHPKDLKGWESTKIYRRGTVKIPQVCAVPGFGDFLNHRIEATNTFVAQMSDNQQQKILDTAMKDLDRLENSKSLEVVIADHLLKEKYQKNT